MNTLKPIFVALAGASAIFITIACSDSSSDVITVPDGSSLADGSGINPDASASDSGNPGDSSDGGGLPSDAGQCAAYEGGSGGRFYCPSEDGSVRDSDGGIIQCDNIYQDYCTHLTFGTCEPIPAACCGADRTCDCLLANLGTNPCGSGTPTCTASWYTMAPDGAVQDSVLYVGCQ